MHRSEGERRLVIEGLIYEAMPSIKRADAERLAHQLSTLLPGISATSSLMKENLRRLSTEIIRISKKKRRPSLSLLDTTKGTSIGQKKTLLPQMNVDAKVERHHTLINAVGETNYAEINQVTNEIRHIRKISSLWTQYSHRFVESLKLTEESVPASKGLPRAVHDIYFRVKLLDVMAIVNAKSSNKFPHTLPCIVERVDWNHLLRDAKEKLVAFRKLERECSSKQNNKFEFQCGSSCYR